MPKIVNHEEYREEILKGSFALFARKGYDAVSMREIAKELDISTGTLYHYFTSKSEIFRQMLELLSKKKVLQILDGLQGTYNPKEKLSSIVQSVLASEKFFQDLLFLLFDYVRKNESEIHDPENFIQPIMNYYKISIQKHLEIKEEKHVEIILNFILGILVQRMIYPNLDVKHQIQAFLFLYGTFSVETTGGLDISALLASAGNFKKQ